MSFTPKHKTKPRQPTPSYMQHKLQPSRSEVLLKKKKMQATKDLLRQMYYAAKFQKWKLTMYGWTKWKDLINFNRLKDVWSKMEEMKKIANINKSLSMEVQELCGMLVLVTFVSVVCTLSYSTSVHCFANLFLFLFSSFLFFFFSLNHN